MALYIEAIDLGLFKEALESCRGFVGNELRICIYRALSSARSRDSMGLWGIEFCDEPFWVCAKLGCRRVYVAYNPSLDVFYVVSGYFAEKVKSFIVAAETASRYLGGTPKRLSIAAPRRDVTLSLRCEKGLDPIKIIINALALASYIACL